MTGETEEAALMRKEAAQTQNAAAISRCLQFAALPDTPRNNNHDNYFLDSFLLLWGLWSLGWLDNVSKSFTTFLSRLIDSTD